MKITEEDINACWAYSDAYLAQILNGEYTIKEAKEDLESLIGPTYDARGIKVEKTHKYIEDPVEDYNDFTEVT